MIDVSSGGVDGVYLTFLGCITALLAIITFTSLVMMNLVLMEEWSLLKLERGGWIMEKLLLCSAKAL